MAGATAAAARADECDALLQKAETRMGQRLDKAVQNQVLLLPSSVFLSCSRKLKSGQLFQHL